MVDDIYLLIVLLLADGHDALLPSLLETETEKAAGKHIVNELPSGRCTPQSCYIIIIKDRLLGVVSLSIGLLRHSQFLICCLLSIIPIVLILVVLNSEELMYDHIIHCTEVYYP